jgi:aquaporin Z
MPGARAQAHPDDEPHGGEPRTDEAHGREPNGREPHGREAGTTDPKAGQDGDPSTEPTMAIRLGAEALGAFALTFVAAGADATARLSGEQVTAFARAIAPGLLVLAMIYAIGNRSGAHFNPAVTLAFALRRLFPPAWVIPYWIAQLVGATVAGALLVGLFGSAAEAGVSTPKLIEPASAVVLEIILTTFLATVILGTANRYQLIGPNAAIAVGSTIALCGLVALPIEGASMNPARSLGPAIATGQLSDAWIYVVGPAVGAVVAVAIARLLHGPPPSGDSKPKEAAQG